MLGFPCNQFGGQEPGSDGEIAEFCRLTYGVEFPMFAKLDVKGPASTRSTGPDRRAAGARSARGHQPQAGRRRRPLEFREVPGRPRRPRRRPLRSERHAGRPGARRRDRGGDRRAALNPDQEETAMRCPPSVIGAATPAPPSPSPAGAASFDCARAKAPDEIAICANPDMSALDFGDGRAVVRLQPGPVPDGHERQPSGRGAGFPATRARPAAPMSACLKGAYAARIATLKQQITVEHRRGMSRQ